MDKGIIVRAEGSLFFVDTGDREVTCTMRGKLKKRQLRVTSLAVVGDIVHIVEAPDGTGSIEEVEPRRSGLSRPGFRGLEHVVAANIDQLIIVQSARQPVFKGRLVDRFLVTARRGNMQPVLVVNKCDLEDPLLLQSWVRPFQANDVVVYLTSATCGEGIDALKSAIEGRISVLAGQSGVGKSSLVNAMYPEISARTGAIASWNNKGRHTTSASRLYKLPAGGYLADTPGIRSLGLMDDDEDIIIEAFPEIEQLAAGCKFRDCTHVHEPHCAVKAAVDSGELDRSRYASYTRMVSGR